MFPPRLAEQPIFYPVLNFQYAEQIARDWNSTRADSDYSGFVVEFEVADAVASRYPAQTAGAADVHRELWVPAEELDAFNGAIESTVRVAATYRRGARVENE
ncbi:MAG: ADP-ribosylation/crystallin J1 [Pseudomonadota bacterium]